MRTLAMIACRIVMETGVAHHMKMNVECVIVIVLMIARKIVQENGVAMLQQTAVVSVLVEIVDTMLIVI